MRHTFEHQPHTHIPALACWCSWLSWVPSAHDSVHERVYLKRGMRDWGEEREREKERGKEGGCRWMDGGSEKRTTYRIASTISSWSARIILLVQPRTWFFAVTTKLSNWIAVLMTEFGRSDVFLRSASTKANTAKKSNESQYICLSLHFRKKTIWKQNRYQQFIHEN